MIPNSLGGDINRRNLKLTVINNVSDKLTTIDSIYDRRQSNETNCYRTERNSVKINNVSSSKHFLLVIRLIYNVVISLRSYAPTHTVDS